MSQANTAKALSELIDRMAQGSALGGILVSVAEEFGVEPEALKSAYDAFRECDSIEPISYESTVAAAREAYKANRLPAQHGGQCQYRPAQENAAFGPCAIGLMLSDNVARFFDTVAAGISSEVEGLAAGDFATFETALMAKALFGADLPKFAELQKAHDDMSHAFKTAERSEDNGALFNKRRHAFESLLGLA